MISYRNWSEHVEFPSEEAPRQKVARVSRERWEITRGFLLCLRWCQEIVENSTTGPEYVNARFCQWFCKKNIKKCWWEGFFRRPHQIQYATSNLPLQPQPVVESGFGTPCMADISNPMNRARTMAPTHRLAIYSGTQGCWDWSCA